MYILNCISVYPCPFHFLFIHLIQVYHNVLYMSIKMSVVNVIVRIRTTYTISMQVVYILDQVRALENEMLQRIKRQGLNFAPRILIVSVFIIDARM